MFIDELGDITRKYNAYHKHISKIKKYINFNKENNYEDPKFKVDDYVI